MMMPVQSIIYDLSYYYLHIIKKNKPQKETSKDIINIVV